MSSEEHFQKVREQIDSVSPSFCLAKWLQVTLHLHNGHNHSCHHPETHKTPLSELSGNPSALHNTLFKKEIRNRMLHGIYPEECNYCWNIEKLGKQYVSDRVMKSSEDWALPQLQTVVETAVSANINPSYVEVSFSSNCNFKCSYCSGNFSSKWREENEKFGPFPERRWEAQRETIAEENNPYVKAFWDWWPDLKKDLKHFRITGGEPLLSPSTFRVLEMIQAEPLPNLHFAVNSNLGTPKVLIEKFIGLASEIVENKKVADFKLYTSIEAWNEKAEYIRNGLDFELFWSNARLILQKIPNLQIIFMATFNSLSVTSFQRLLEETLKLRAEFQHQDRIIPICVDIAYLRDPLFLNIQVLSEEFLPQMEGIVQFMEDNKFDYEKRRHGFHQFELIKAKRTLEWMKSPLPADELRNRRYRFYHYFAEHDRRRSTDFLKTFPEMEKFWNLCKNS
jgi:organic radical activating enzyme